MQEQQVLDLIEELLGWATIVRDYAFFLEPMGIGDEVTLSLVVRDMQAEITYLTELRSQIQGGIIYIDLDEVYNFMDTTVREKIGGGLVSAHAEARCSWALPWVGWWVPFPDDTWMPGAPGRPP